MSIEKNNQQPARNLPEYTIGNTVFLVDVANLELREKANQANVIPFEDLYYEGSHYSVWYEDQKTPSATYHMPNLVELDKEGMALRYNLAINEMERKTDFEIIVDQAFYLERKNGVLPTVQIGELMYYVDYRLNMLRPNIDHLNTIKFWPDDLRFDDLKMINGGKAYTFFFDIEKQSLFVIDEKMMSVPPTVYLVTIPTEDILDPYAHARKWGVDIESHLINNPPQRSHSATLVPADQTFLKDMVNENRQKFKEDDPGELNNNKQQKKK